MALIFGVDDDDRFSEARGRLLGELAERLGDGADPEVVGDAGLLLDWTRSYADGELDRYTVNDLAEYLLDWCPRKVFVAPEACAPILEGAKEWILHLVLTKQWRGGPVQPLLRYLDEVRSEFTAAMSDSSTFGVTKGIVGSGPMGFGLDLDDPAAIQSAMDRFNSLSFEERSAIMDPLLPTAARGTRPGAVPSGAAGPEELLEELLGVGVVDLPVARPLDHALINAEAAEAPLVVQLDAVRDHIGGGVGMTGTGNPKLADAKVMVELFATDDVWDPTIADRRRSTRSADELPHLQFLLEVAVDAGALTDTGRKFVPGPEWSTLDSYERCAELLASVLAVGAVSARAPGVTLGDLAPFERLHDLLDDGILHWVVPALVSPEVPVEDIVDACLDVVLREPRVVPAVLAQPQFLQPLMEERVGWGLDALERCGVIVREGTHDEADVANGGFVRVGGTIRMTELGRSLIATYLPMLGYRMTTFDQLADADAAVVAEAFTRAQGMDPLEMWELWQPDVDPADKVDALIDALVDARNAHVRLGASTLLSAATVGPRDRLLSLLGGPLSAYALLALDRRIASEELDVAQLVEPWRTVTVDGRSASEVLTDLGPGIVLRPVVDMFAIEMELDPDGCIEYLVDMDSNGGGSEGSFTSLLTDLWRVPGAETVAVLEFVGANHPVKATAKAARKAVLKHRSMYPGA